MRKNGLKFAFTEMLAIKPLLTESVKSWSYLKTNGTDVPLGAQIVGRDPAMMARAAEILERANMFDAIDVNFGCPVKKVAGKGEGSALLKEPKQIEKILRAIIKRVSVPITCKIRLGWDTASMNACDIARIAEDTGVRAVTVHGRTKDAGYSGDVNLSGIAAVKRSVSIPVIGNGNIFSRKDAERMFAETGCDHVMIARGALGNPWLFDEIENNIPNTSVTDIATVKNMALEHAALLRDFYGEKKAVLLLRKVGCWYFKFLPEKAHYKFSVSHINAYDEFLAAVETYAQDHHNPMQ